MCGEAARLLRPIGFFACLACTPATDQPTPPEPRPAAVLLDADEGEAEPPLARSPGSFIGAPEPEASFIVRPDVGARLEGCELERRRRTWCVPTDEADLLDRAPGHRERGCPRFVRGSGRDEKRRGSAEFPRCAIGQLEPCETDARRSTAPDVCCYAWSCPVQ